MICDYATWFPEVFPLATITAPAVMPCLIQLFLRVGVLDKIITDQGTSFTCRLLQLFHRQLGIKAIKATTKHPLTNGLVEQLNHIMSPTSATIREEKGKADLPRQPAEKVEGGSSAGSSGIPVGEVGGKQRGGGEYTNRPQPIC